MNDQNRVMVKVAETAELVVEITDKVVRGFRECNRMFETEGDGKDCGTCILDMKKGFCKGMCEIDEVVDAIERRCSHEQTEV